ncbi:hypothetical protein MKY84_12475 [Chryseomicrobium sp. FSL W7-1435]|uniref:hypothetical protein n=1 Tax=Chryseomicrobium sp. FSL W7-1435 TaxID=2921704 RepID=UPI003159A926
MLWIVAIVAIVTTAGVIEKYMKHQVRIAEIKNQAVKDELALEQQRYENFVLETEKMRLELDYKRDALTYTKDPVVEDLEKHSSSSSNYGQN